MDDQYGIEKCGNCQRQTERSTSDATATCPADRQRTPAYPEHRKRAGQCIHRSPCRCDLPAWLVGRCFVLPGYAKGGTANEAAIMQVRGLHGGGESVSAENLRLHGRADAQLA